MSNSKSQSGTSAVETRSYARTLQCNSVRPMGLVVLAWVLGAGSLALAEETATPAKEKMLGAVEFPVSCTTAVQTEFERGVALLHHMMYVESRKTFEEVVKKEPDCAMAQWGVAMTLFQPLWPTRPSPAALTRGWQAAQKAKALAPETEREKVFIAAVQSFFRKPESPDYWARIGRFEQAMEKVFRAYPTDHEAAAFYALSHLATAPRSDETMAHHDKAAAILLGVYEEEPTHPGAIHYTIHANDIDGREAESLHVIRSYGDIAPSVPHALHMPTHIFVRLGAWEDVIQWNRRSADAALNFPAATEPVRTVRGSGLGWGAAGYFGKEGTGSHRLLGGRERASPRARRAGHTPMGPDWRGESAPQPPSDALQASAHL